MRTELLQAMAQMVSSENWQGFLYFRRNYVSLGGEPPLIRKMICTLPDKSQLAYARYFNSSDEVSKRIKKRLGKERLEQSATRKIRKQNPVFDYIR